MKTKIILHVINVPLFIRKQKKKKMDKYIKEEKTNLPEELIKDPYNYILNFVENILPYTGKRVFELLSLMPCSLILPDLKYKGKKIRSNINVLFLASPSGGKSTISEILSSISFSPLSVRSITPAKLESKVQSNPFFTLIVEDYATMSKDATVTKIIEGCLGEEKRIQRSTMRGDVDTETEGVGLICGVPTDLREHLSGGLIFRFVPKVIFHSIEEHSKIGKDISEGIGKDSNFEQIEENIKNYYKELLKIQNEKHPIINQITGYEIKKEFIEKAYKSWDRMTREIYKKTKAPYNWFRSLHEFCRFLISHAFLNVFNRKVENGILYPNEEDFKIALKLMKEDLNLKFKLINTEIFIRSISTLKDLYNVINSDRVGEENKNLILSLANLKEGKLKK